MKHIFTSCIALLMVLSVFSCKNEKKTDVADAVKIEESKGAEYNVSENSMVLWKGNKPAGMHEGTINVAEGKVVVDGDKVVGGSFILDMNSISCTDLEGDEKLYLEGHLKGSDDKNRDDFFNVAAYPTASFEISKVSALINDPEANSLVYGNLKLKNVTKLVSFKANVEMSTGSVSVSTPMFKINRTDFGIKYGSKSFFSNLGDKFIDDEIELIIKLVASK